jgi:molybdate transport system substrate-binding protein
MRRRPALALVVVLVLTACGDGSSSSGPPTVLAAASLTRVFTELGGARFAFAGSQAVVSQLEQGAPADVIALADTEHMQSLVEAGLVEKPTVFARNTLAIAVAPGNPKHVSTLADLSRDDLIVVLADSAVPVGAYSRTALDRAGVTVHPRSLELDVRAALAKVSGGEADAAIVYASDVKAAASTVSGVVIPADANVIAVYPIAIVRDASHRARAEAFVRRVLSAEGQHVLRAHGFLAAT